jgi:hypothetical protein
MSLEAEDKLLEEVEPDALSGQILIKDIKWKIALKVVREVWDDSVWDLFK